MLLYNTFDVFKYIYVIIHAYTLFGFNPNYPLTFISIYKIIDLLFFNTFHCFIDIKNLFFDDKVPHNMKLECLSQFQKYVGCPITPLEIYEDKSIWISFFETTEHKILSRL